VANVSVISTALRKVHVGHNLFSLSSWFFTVVFSMGTESLNCDASSTYVPLCASTCTKIFILSLVNDFHFPLLSIFHLLAMKLLINNKIWSVWNEVTWALGDWRM
jgi:hypothetical protein